ncbi:MAG TPA: DUF1080 domain-containing protein [Chryseolinea sp.]|nr:DUF1080 domain-containing protein [Chryseolinea sp.]
MKLILTACMATLLLTLFTGMKKVDNTMDEWIPLFDGKSLSNWKISEHPETFSVADGSIVVFGERAHLFYDGPVKNHDFKNFEFKAQVMTTPGSNSGIFVHTAFQPEGWPSKGYEIQVNNSHTDWRRTGSVYALQDVKEAPAKDNVWFTQHIIVQGDKITVKVNDKTINEYTEKDPTKITTGTFALQGHDPKSKVYYKDIMVKPLPD